MDAFAQAVNGWHDYYHVIGDAAAALMGLLFVSLSLNAGVITRKDNEDLRALAAQTFTSFICLIMFALLFVIPNQGPRGLGLPMLGIDLIMLFVTAKRVLQVRRKGARLWGRGSLMLRFIIPTICFVIILVVAITVLLGMTGGLYWFVPVTILLIWDASLNAWDLLLRLHVPERLAEHVRRVEKK
jgi:hypothetical protein